MSLFHRRTHEDDVREMKRAIQKADKKYSANEKRSLIPQLRQLRGDWAHLISDDLLEMLDDTIERWEKGE